MKIGDFFCTLLCQLISFRKYNFCMNNKRTQLSLFISEDAAETIESIRKKYNPLQYELIKSHVTICREDELEEIESVKLNLENLNQSSIDILFGAVVRFDNGKGVMLPAIGNNKPFENLRKIILEGIIETPRKHEPHITLMHPRNSTCTDEMFKEVKDYNFPSKITFHTISLIEQEIGMPWNIVKVFELKSTC
jgi:2'-5' RNA ligase